MEQPKAAPLQQGATTASTLPKEPLVRPANLASEVIEYQQRALHAAMTNFNKVPKASKPIESLELAKQVPQARATVPASGEIYSTKLRDQVLIERAIYEAQPQLSVDEAPVTPIESAVPRFGIDALDAEFIPIEPVSPLAASTSSEEEPPALRSKPAALKLAAVVSREVATTTAAAWAAELGKEPLEVYEDFAEALASLAESLSYALLGDEAAEPDTEHQELHPAVPVLTALAEQLAGLKPDKKELVAPILKDLVGAIHGRQLLEAHQADASEIMAVEAQLEELCVKLFETIGLDFDYTKQDVGWFVHAILSQEFRPPQSTGQEAAPLDLEHIGTHEAKHFGHFTGSLVYAEGRFQRMLGRFVLRYTRGVDGASTSAHCAELG